MAKGPSWKARPATIGLIAVCTLAFLITWVLVLVRADEPARTALESLWVIDDVEVLDRAGALVAAKVWLDQAWWRVGSAGLLHGSWLHLVLNCWGLWVVGQWTEKVWGPWRQLVLFTLASLGGCLASLVWAEAPIVVGASAGIFGVAGALVVVRAWGRPEQRETIHPVSAKVLGFWLGLWLVVGALLPLFGVSLLAQAGHAGGLAVGCLVGWMMSRSAEQRFMRIAAGVLVALFFALGIPLGIEPSWRPNYHLFLGGELVDRGELELALESFEHALEAERDDAELHNFVAYSLAEGGVELERARELIEVSLTAEPDNADYLDTLGWIQCKLGETEAGVESLEAAAEAAEREIPEIAEHLERCASVGE